MPDSPREIARQLEAAGLSRRDAQAIARGPADDTPGHWGNAPRTAQQHATPPGRPAGRARHAQQGTQAQAAADARHAAARELAADWIILEARVRARFPRRSDTYAVLTEAERIVEQLRRAQAAGQPQG